MEHLGLSIDTSDKVYEPSDDSFLAADIVNSLVAGMSDGIEVLDLGTGTGILGLVAAKSKKVKRVVFADINEDAVELCRKNIGKNRSIISARCEVLKSNLFSKIKGEFDLIIFNAPYLPDDNKIKMSEAWYGGKGGVELSINMLKESGLHLKQNGRVLLIESSFGDLDRLSEEMGVYGYSVDYEKKTHIDFEDIIGLVLKR